MRAKADAVLLRVFRSEVQKLEREYDVYGMTPASSYLSNPIITSLLDNFLVIWTREMLAAKIPQWKHHERRGQALFKLIADLQVEFAAQFEAARLETNRKAREKRGTARTAAGKAGMSESDDGDDEDGEAAMQSDGADCDFAEDQEVPIAAPKPTGKRRAPFDDATNVPRAAKRPRAARAIPTSMAKVTESFGPTYKPRVRCGDTEN
ncbi:hypothetical protein B0H10DRAFT_829530 [Mycena sp. CBHHK59/15]|nr:hypothetical protein B0H10DRAFT_829530 [Mycena sp. CBHHK59/15]